MTNIINSNIHIAANNINFNLKKIKLHARLTTNWIKYVFKEIERNGESDCDIIKEDIPIRIYKIVQTIGNKIPAGAKGGFTKSVYPLLEPDKKPTNVPNPNGISI